MTVIEHLFQLSIEVAPDDASQLVIAIHGHLKVDAVMTMSIKEAQDLARVLLQESERLGAVCTQSGKAAQKRRVMNLVSVKYLALPSVSEVALK